MKLNLYSISDEYIQYMKKYDKRIYDNKEEKRVHTRKYLGVALTINNMNYFIPMSSPKNTDYYDKQEKQVRKSIVPIIRMVDIKNKNRLYGTLRLSNMIPVPITEIEPYIVSKEKDINYKNMVLGEISFIERNKNMIIKYAETIYNQKVKNKDIPYVKNCVNYSLLEKRCKEYIAGQYEGVGKQLNENDIGSTPYKGRSR